MQRFLTYVTLQNAKSVSAWSRSRGRRRRGSTRSAYESLRSRRENNEPASRRLRNGSVVRKRKGECQRRRALRYTFDIYTCMN